MTALSIDAALKLVDEVIEAGRNDNSPDAAAGTEMLCALRGARCDGGSMSASSDIEWTDATWQVTTGCARVSPECGTHEGGCYAERMAWRLSHNPATSQYQGTVRMTEHGPRWTGLVRPFENELLAPLSWRKPRRVFVDSMSDLFHEDVPDAHIDAVFATMLACEFLEGRTRHTFQVLTKRAERMAAYFAAPPATLLDRWGRAADRSIILDNADVYFSEAVYGACTNKWDENRCGLEKSAPWSHPENLFPLRNVWLGVSCGTRKHGLPRLDHLRRVPAAVRFVSFEPLLEDLGDVDLDGIGWAIAGAESGPKARAMEEAWVRRLRDQCVARNVRFFYKQRLDGRRRVSLPVLDGRAWQEMPEVRRG